jgi:hypothetical protein
MRSCRVWPHGSASRFWGRHGVRVVSDRRHHGEGQHDQRDVTMPSVPGAGFVVVKPQLVLGGFEAVLDRPAVSFDCHQGCHTGAGRTPGGEEGEVVLGDVATDQPTAGPQAGALVIVVGGVEIGQFAIGPIVPPRAFAAVARRPARPRRSLEIARDRLWSRQPPVWSRSRSCPAHASPPAAPDRPSRPWADTAPGR